MSAQLTFRSPQVEIPYVVPNSLTVVLAILALIGLVLADTAPVARATAEPAATHVTGRFSGEYENGVPVYRLPAIEIKATRQERRVVANAAGQTPAGRPHQ